MQVAARALARAREGCEDVQAEANSIRAEYGGDVGSLFGRGWEEAGFGGEVEELGEGAEE